MVGTSVGLMDGADEGTNDGAFDGAHVGDLVGSYDGFDEGLMVGFFVIRGVGEAVLGMLVVGRVVGWTDGCLLCGLSSMYTVSW